MPQPSIAWPLRVGKAQQLCLHEAHPSGPRRASPRTRVQSQPWHARHAGAFLPTARRAAAVAERVAGAVQAGRRQAVAPRALDEGNGPPGSRVRAQRVVRRGRRGRPCVLGRKRVGEVRLAGAVCDHALRDGAVRQAFSLLQRARQGLRLASGREASL